MPHPQPANTETPAFEPHPGDASLEDSVIFMSDAALRPDAPVEMALTGSPEEVDAFWRNESAQRLAREGSIPPKKTHEEYLAAAKTMLEIAVLQEGRLGLDATVDLYRKAGVQFLGAIGSTPLRESLLFEAEEPDPILELQYATCIAKQADATEVKPYTSPESQGRDRRQDLKRIARETFHRSWDRIVNSSDTADDVLVPAAIVTAEGLTTVQNNPEARIVLAQARTRLALRDRDSEMVSMMDHHATTPEKERTFTRQEVAAEALIDLATDSHEVLAML